LGRQEGNRLPQLCLHELAHAHGRALKRGKNRRLQKIRKGKKETLIVKSSTRWEGKPLEGQKKKMSKGAGKRRGEKSMVRLLQNSRNRLHRPERRVLGEKKGGKVSHVKNGGVELTQAWSREKTRLHTSDTRTGKKGGNSLCLQNSKEEEEKGGRSLKVKNNTDTALLRGTMKKVLTGKLGKLVRTGTA